MMRATSLCVLTLILVVGCKGGGSRLERVEGTITYKGQPVAGATVMFSPVGEGATTAGFAITDENGHYQLQGQTGKGIGAGEYAVAVSKVQDVPTGETTVTPEGKEQPVVEGRSLLPDKYRFAGSSPLRAKVVPGQKNVFDFDLTD